MANKKYLKHFPTVLVIDAVRQSSTDVCSIFFQPYIRIMQHKVGSNFDDFRAKKRTQKAVANFVFGGGKQRWRAV